MQAAPTNSSTICQANNKAIGNLLLGGLQAVHGQDGRGEADAEAALALQAEALQCAVGAAHHEALVTACNP